MFLGFGYRVSLLGLPAVKPPRSAWIGAILMGCALVIVLGTVILDACGLTSAKSETAVVLTVAGIFYTSIAMLMSAINTVHKREREKTTGSGFDTPSTH
jgi:hypothetical protein